MIEKLKKIWALLCLIPLLSYVIIAHLLVFPVNIFDRPENVITLSISMVIIITSYAVIFVFFKQMSQQFTIESEQQLLKSQIGALQNQLSTIKEVEEKANILKHDMRHYIQNISVLLQSGNSDETTKYIDKFRITSYNVCYTKLLRTAKRLYVVGWRLYFLANTSLYHKKMQFI